MTVKEAITTSSIADAVAQHLGNDYFMVDAQIGTGHTPKVTVIVDGDKGITIDDCTKLSRKLMPELEKTYKNCSLEVTSPGLGQPLAMPRQYVRNVGRELEVRLNDGNIVKGTLLACGPEKIELRVTDKKSKKTMATTVPFTEIDKTCVQISLKKKS